jgi:methionyl-tRNA synthetase
MYAPERFLVTSALPYANGPLHVGHLTGAYLPADVFVRYLRQQDKDVVFICGSDEHGAAITMRALKEEKTPKEIVDKYHELFEDTFKKMGVSFDFYHRTSAPLHHETAQSFFRELYTDGKLIEKESEQYFDEASQQFLADRYIIGTCPRCSFEEAYGDQCENCGSTLSPEELIDPRSKLSGSKPIIKKTRHWYLPLDQHEDWLREWIEHGTIDGKEHHDVKTWKNHVTGQCKSWLDNGLTSRAMTRDLDWGVDVPEDIPNAEGKKLYVWMDAPIGYVSATKAWAEEHAADLEDGMKAWKKYWQDENTALVHFIGKDNIVFHCLIFPAILKAHGGYNLPVNVPANQFLNLEGRKISTSRNWAIWAHEFVEELPELVDVLRYYLVKNMPEQKDSEFTWQGFQDANNNELVNNLANFINRVVVLCNKYFEGSVPEPDQDLSICGPEYLDEPAFVETELLRLYDLIFEAHVRFMNYDFRAALQAVMDISTFGNQLLQNNEPWKTIKTEPEAAKTSLFIGVQIVYALALLIRPFMPTKSDELIEMLGVEVEPNGSILKMMDDLAEGLELIPAGHQLHKAKHLFSRIPDELIQKQVDKLMATDTEDTEDAIFEPLKSDIDFESFAKMDLRTGTVVSAEKIKKANKLLKLKVDLGFEERTIVSGIAEQYDPESVVGKKVCVVANLAPKKLRGEMSRGMILMTEDQNGKLKFVSPENSAENGLTVR